MTIKRRSRGCFEGVEVFKERSTEDRKQQWREKKTSTVFTGPKVHEVWEQREKKTTGFI